MIFVMNWKKMNWNRGKANQGAYPRDNELGNSYQYPGENHGKFF